MLNPPEDVEDPNPFGEVASNLGEVARILEEGELDLQPPVGDKLDLRCPELLKPGAPPEPKENNFQKKRKKYNITY